jgi:hypothetical protein
MLALFHYFTFFPSTTKSCKSSSESEILCDDDVDGRYQVVVIRHYRHKCLEVIVVCKETGNEAPRLYLSLKKTIQLITKISKDVKLQSTAFGIRKSIIDWLLVDFILTRLTIEEHGRKRVLFVDLLLHIEDTYDQTSTCSTHQQVMPLQTSSLSIIKPSDLIPFDFKLHWMQKTVRSGSNLRLLFTSGSSHTAAQKRWKWAIRRVLFRNLRAKLIRRLLCSSSSLSSQETLSDHYNSPSRAITLSSYDTVDTANNTIVDSPVKVKPTATATAAATVVETTARRKSSSSSRDGNEMMFFSASRFRHLF